jgi:hypothetical protein
MIRISATQSKVVLTLKEKSTIENPYWTFRITNSDSKVQTIFQGWNTSTSFYYDSFTLSVGTPESLTASVVLDIPNGEYSYSVYEMANQWDLDLDNASKIVEVGILIVTGTSSPIISYDGNDDQTFITYGDY